MKKVIPIVFLTLLFFSCRKKDVQQVLLEHYPQNWVLTADESPTEYFYIKSNNGSPLYRDHVLNTYSLIQLAEDEDCKFHVATSRNVNNEICFTIQSLKDMGRWWCANMYSNGTDAFMIQSNSGSTSIPPSGDPSDGEDYDKFFIHDMPKVNGVKTVTIESCYYRGWYISLNPPSFQFANNLITLRQDSSPEGAQHFQCR